MILFLENWDHLFCLFRVNKSKSFTIEKIKKKRSVAQKCKKKVVDNIFFGTYTKQ